MFNFTKRAGLLALVSVCALLGVQALEESSLFQRCDQTLCPKLGSLRKCSPRWYKALDACYAPPCNIRYIRDPAADCRKPATQPIESREQAVAKTCEDTLCPRLGSFKKCSPIWYKALNACYSPPCNRRPIRDPAADCPAQSIEPRKEPGKTVVEKCENSLCGRSNSFPKCSPEWIEAVHSCYGPPCNRVYIRDPAADCQDQLLESREEAVAKTCYNSLCGRSGNFPKCSPLWIKAVHSCYGPPCNIRYIRDPADDCRTQPLESRDEAVAKTCENSLCARSGNFPKCSPLWIKAIHSCYGPPCNRRYIRDPVDDCRKPATQPLESREEAVAKTCENTLCPKLNSFPECSKDWYRALQACIDPPCNYRYLVDPAANCKKTTQPCPTQTVLVSGRCPPIIPPPRPCIEPDCIVRTTTTTTLPCKNPNCPVTPTVTSTRTCPPTKSTCRSGCATATATVTATCKSDYK